MTPKLQSQKVAHYSIALLYSYKKQHISELNIAKKETSSRLEKMQNISNNGQKWCQKYGFFKQILRFFVSKRQKYDIHPK